MNLSEYGLFVKRCLAQRPDIDLSDLSSLGIGGAFYTGDQKQSLRELGEILWHVVAIATKLNVSVEEVMTLNYLERSMKQHTLSTAIDDARLACCSWDITVSDAVTVPITLSTEVFIDVSGIPEPGRRKLITANELRRSHDKQFELMDSSYKTEYEAWKQTIVNELELKRLKEQ